MATKYKLIHGAQAQSQAMQQIVENIKAVAASIDEDPIKLLEGATQVLAALKQIVTSGQPLTKAGMSPASLAGIVSGLKVLTSAMPKITDPQQKQRAQQILSNLTIGNDNVSLKVASTLANLAQKDPNLEQVRTALTTYAQSGQPNPELAKMLGQLQMAADQALRATQQQAGQPQQQAGQQPAPQQQQKTPAPAVTSGTVATVGQNA